MILTCPECATSYFVDESRIPADGRKVRCSTCGHRWTADPDGRVIEPAPEPFAAEFEAAADVAPGEAEPDVVAVEPDPPLVAPIIRSSTARKGTLGDGRRRRAGVLAWAGLAAVAAALIAGAIVFREQMVRLWPASSAAYAGLGLELAGDGLVLEQVQARPVFLAGRPVLSVTGAIHNPRDVAIDCPPVRVTLFNKSGQPVAAKIARPAEASIPARSRRHFAITLIDPPAAARDLEVRFEGKGHGKPATLSAAAPSSQPPQPAKAPIEASPAPPLSRAAATEHG